MTEHVYLDMADVVEGLLFQDLAEAWADTPFRPLADDEPREPRTPEEWAEWGRWDG